MGEKKEQRRNKYFFSHDLRLLVFSQVLFRGFAFKRQYLVLGSLTNSGFKGLDTVPDQESRRAFMCGLKRA